MSDDAVNYVFIVLTCLLIIFGILNCYVTWVTLSAFYFVKNSGEYIPSAVNTNYDPECVTTPEKHACDKEQFFTEVAVN